MLAGSQGWERNVLKYLRSVRGRMLCIALVPAGALVVVALVIGIFLVRQAIQTRETAESTAGAAAGVARTVVSLQAQRSEAMRDPERRTAAFASLTQRIDNAIGSLREFARHAPGAESGFQQATAVQLLSVAESMDRADSLAVGGLDAVSRRSFVLAVGAYRAGLVQVSGQLTESGRVLYESVVHTADWSRLAAAEDALAAGSPLPITQASWRTSAYDVSQELGALYSQQSQYAVQLTLDEGRRTLAGALAASAAILLFAAIIVLLVRRLVARLPVPVVPIMFPAGENAIPRPRHAVSHRAVGPDPRLMKAVLEGLRRS